MTFQKSTKTILFASLIALFAIPIAMSQSVEAADSCPSAGTNGEVRCYATKTYYLKSTVQPLNVNTDVYADDISMGWQSGFIQNAVWTYLSDGRFIEAGFIDQSGTNGERMVCGTGGGTSNFMYRSFGDNDQFNTYSIELSSGAVFKTGIKHMSSGDETSCSFTSPPSTYPHMTAFVLGTEASSPDTSDFEHDWQDLEIDYSDVVSTQFSGTPWIKEAGTDYDVENCGSGNEQYRHIHTGKRNLSSC